MDEPFERRVLLGLSDSLAALQQAVVSAGASGNFQPFQDAVPLGISANLCDALVGLSMDGTAEDVTFQISWSPTRRVTDKIPSRFRFGRDAFPVLKEAAYLLRISVPIEDFLLYGTVTSLHREDTTNTGRVMVDGLIENAWRKVRMELTDSDYMAAVTAHRTKDFVSCVGKLVKRERIYHLLNVRDLAILEYPDRNTSEIDVRTNTSVEATRLPVSAEDADDADPFAEE